MATIMEFKAKLRSNPEVAKMIMPSSRNEVFFDLEGDGKLDFALLDRNGDAKMDAFAIDLTGDGSLDVYFSDSDGNGIVDTVQVVADGDDMPSMAFADKSMEERIKVPQDMLQKAMESNDVKEIIEVIKTCKEQLKEMGAKYRTNGTLGRLRHAIENDPKMAKFLCPSASNEIYLDVDGDGKADFGFISNGPDKYPDTFAMDLGCDGEFDLYLTDTDRNGLPDFVTFFKDGVDGPAYTSSEPSKEIEDVVAPAVEKLTTSLRAQFEADNFISTLKAFKEEVIGALKAFQESN